MPRGGKRPGAGRKNGAATKKTREVADRAASSGEVTPLEVMLAAMRAHHAAGRLDRAAAVARDAAPYVHPRLSAVQHDGRVGVTLEVVEEIVDAPLAEEGEGPPAPGPGGIPAV